MCLYNLHTNRIELHNDALEDLLGIHTRDNEAMIEVAQLRPKKKFIEFQDSAHFSKVKKMFDKNKLQVDKTPTNVKHVIMNILNNLHHK